VRLGEQNVLRLDVAMDHALAVDVVQRVCDLVGNRQRLIDWELFLAVETVAQRLAVHKGHDVIQQPTTRAVARVPGGAGVEQREDVRVAQARGDLDLAQKAVSPERGS
jgi:hypothetical protein